ncbi:stellacyanin-like protein [Cinnamomum micranthum f. kanehirae]|uniref:Stellacyanin-like protein n=1 Tax=Cinnamomum micranthum f. kanehirae TaxID=337451 RepID=A0A3S3MYU7_9MAGN|nr:stellacyanin-like protein [Cinnamomum micranthum f. kanehirae]
MVRPSGIALCHQQMSLWLQEMMKWYICGISKHCVDGGQKLAITVEAAVEGPSLPPTPSKEAGAPTINSANGVLQSGYHALLAAIALLAMVVMV